MMVNPNADGYTMTLNHRNVLRKTQNINKLLKTKIKLKPKNTLSGGPVFTFSLSGEKVIRPSVLLSVVTLHVGLRLQRNMFFCSFL